MWIVLLNASAGGARQTDLAVRIAALFAAEAKAVEVRPVSGSIGEAARMAAGEPGVDAVVAAGGDGTVSAVAAALADTGMPMAILPLGTRNHFARDLGIPLALDAAVRAAVSGRARQVDVGEVNGRVFVNNSSVGLYPDVVRERARHGWARRAGKVLATARAAWRVLRQVKRRHVLLETPEGKIVRDVPFVFVGNNDYDPMFLTGRSRECLDRGELSLWMPRKGASRRVMLVLLLRSLIGRLQTSPALERVCLPELWVDLGKPRVRVATDGEIVRMSTPLHYRVRPRALTVFAPA